MQQLLRDTVRAKANVNSSRRRSLRIILGTSGIDNLTSQVQISPTNCVRPDKQSPASCCSTSPQENYIEESLVNTSSNIETAEYHKGRSFLSIKI